MNDKQQLAADAAKFAGQFKSFLDAAALIGAIGSLDQAEAEARTRLEAARQREAVQDEKLSLERTAADDYVLQQQADADSLVVKARADAKTITAKAISTGDDVISAARIKAESIIAAAEREAASIDIATAAAQEVLRDLTIKVGDAKDTLAAAEIEAATAGEKRDAILAQLAALKAKF